MPELSKHNTFGQKGMEYKNNYITGNSVRVAMGERFVAAHLIAFDSVIMCRYMC